MDTKNAKEIYDKYKNTKNSHIYEIILQLYLISSGFRNIALVYLQKSSSEKIIKFLRKNNIPFYINYNSFNFFFRQYTFKRK